MKKIIYLSLLVLFVDNLSISKLIFNPILWGWLKNVIYIIVLLIYFKTKIGNKERTIISTLILFYVFFMTIGMMLHLLFTKMVNPVSSAMIWIIPFVLIDIIYQKFNKNFFKILIISFFIIHCSIAVYEIINNKNLISFSFVDEFNNYKFENSFRAFGLMEHPLYSANVTIIILSFVLLNQSISNRTKLPLIFLGSIAMFAFDSRAALLIWLFIVFYRIFLYKLKFIQLLILVLLSYLLLQFNLISNSGVDMSLFGRLSNGFTDSSSLTRLLSFVYFTNESWSMKDIFVGGRYLYMPGTELYLENGILMTIGLWGWVVGIVKIIFEIIISFKLLNNYQLKSKVLILIATWLTSFANNNSFNTFVFVFFVFSAFSFSKYELFANEAKTILK